MSMRKMDDPYDAKNSEEPESLFGEVALRAAGAVIPLANVIDTVRDHFSRAAVAKQVPASVEGVNSKIPAQKPM